MKRRIDMAYVAGLMDGDGSFSIAKEKTNSSPLYYPMLQLSKSSKIVMDSLVEIIGGKFFTANRVHKCKDGSNGSVIYQWKLRGSTNVRPVLNELREFLKIKQDRADLLLSFIDSFNFVRGYKLSSDKLADRERYYLKMIKLNSWTSFNNRITTKLAHKITEDQIFWSYVAGIMDTDGSFSIKKQNINKGTQVINPRYSPVISVSSVDLRAINYIRENCSIGNMYIPKNKGTSNGFHYQYGIYTKKECIEFLQRIIPFLRHKKKNAEILLKFCIESQNTKHCRLGVSQEELAFRESCYQQLISCNSKYGVYKSSLIDLKLLPGSAGDNKGQAGNVQAERASGKTSKDDAVL